MEFVREVVKYNGFSLSHSRDKDKDDAIVVRNAMVNQSRAEMYVSRPDLIRFGKAFISVRKIWEDGYFHPLEFAKVEAKVDGLFTLCFKKYGWISDLKTSLLGFMSVNDVVVFHRSLFGFEDRAEMELKYINDRQKEDEPAYQPKELYSQYYGGSLFSTRTVEALPVRSNSASFGGEQESSAYSLSSKK